MKFSYSSTDSARYCSMYFKSMFKYFTVFTVVLKELVPQFNV